MTHSFPTRRCADYLVGGERITDKKVAEIELITFAGPASELDAKVNEWVKKFTENAASRAIKYTKTTINIGLQQMLKTMVDVGFAYEMLSGRTKDHSEAIDALAEKRKPTIIGR